MNIQTVIERLGAYCSVTRTKKNTIASALGLTLNSLNNKLDGKTPFLFDEALKLADILGCSVDDFNRPPIYTADLCGFIDKSDK